MQYRFWEVDLLRGTAVVSMVLYHLAFDLNYFQIYRIDVASGPALAAARITLSLFLLLAGLSLTLSRSRSRLSGQKSGYLLHLAERALFILLLAMGISVVTYHFLGECFIAFGALHLIAISLLFAYPFLGMGRNNFIFGMLIIVAGLYLPALSVGHPWLLWLGLSPPGYCSVDYTPVVPWFGVVLIGAALGDLLYPGFQRKIRLPDWESFAPVRVLAMLGRHSLAVYLIHQPALIALLYLIGFNLSWH
ncbi:MAG TPA: heparan-alpha-glucosaminide N-acetyltransferase [Methanothrix sp.]|nr:DUF1624 domain-containing protein [Methanothrix sp.]HOV82362.1 heparan-alpha-glucosaminide N-acetyltransferase [Methanothrix sp.]HPC88789.1 heparan-alpha-glucosaminide N-acetyltransferase [Methanothrix sp.]HQI67455.1 heparan-alpha-glucosaminide N-acetyltransferase [Methanothrix sp.]HRS84765.1 heparan-alpha-glucosaminide N-acetyltransferase [Methanothrix sp.]